MTPRFIADINVGKLAKWLRIAGYDVLLPRDSDDAGLVTFALRENRILLTRDTSIAKRRVVSNGALRVILLSSEEPRAQLRQVMQEMNATSPPPELSRCLRDNEELVARSREEVEGQVPPYVYRTQESYMQCPKCLRIYWRGTHWEKMRKWLEEMRGGGQESGVGER